MIGSGVVFDMVAGPGDSVSGVQENNKNLRFQNMPLSGSAPVNPDGTSAVGSADLSDGAQANNATVGLLDAATPVVAFERGSEAVFRRFDGSGSVNDAANWTPPVSLGPLYGPVLAGGPSGLFLLGRTANVLQPGSVFVRKFDGTTFGPPVTIDTSSGPARGPRSRTRYAGGRLHAVYPQGDAETVTLAARGLRRRDDLVQGHAREPSRGDHRGDRESLHRRAGGPHRSRRGRVGDGPRA